MIIRAYRKEDRAQVEEICANGGLRGQLERYFSDQELFAKLWLAPFLDGEPEATWVAEDDGVIVGYLVSSIRPGFRRRSLVAMLPHLVRLMLNVLGGKYRDEPHSRRFIRWLFLRSWREVPRSEPGASNFHFQVRESYRGSERLGDLLAERYFAELRRRGIARFYVHVFGSAGRRDLNFYRRTGFRLGDVRCCSLFQEPTVVACLVKEVPDPGWSWQSHRVGRPPRITVVFEVPRGAEGSDQLLRDLEAQALPAHQVSFSDDSVDLQGEILVSIKGAARLGPDLLARVAIAVESGSTNGRFGKHAYYLR